MSPIVLLRDEATTLCLDTHPEPSKKLAAPLPGKPTKAETLDDFTDYVKALLEETNAGHHARLLSPTAAVGKRLSICEEAPTTSKEAIEMAILGAGPRDAPASVMFEIARNGQRVGTVNLARSAYKLGETITAVIDLQNAQTPCYHVSLALSPTFNPDFNIAEDQCFTRILRNHRPLPSASLRIFYSPCNSPYIYPTLRIHPLY